MLRTSGRPRRAAGAGLRSGRLPGAARPGLGGAGAAERGGLRGAAVRLQPAATTSGPIASSSDYVAWGAGPRGSQNLVLAAKAHALLQGRHGAHDRRRAGRGAAGAAPSHDRQSPGGRRRRQRRRHRRPSAERGGRMSAARRSSRFLDLRALAALQHLRFAPRQRIEGTFSGRHPRAARAGRANSPTSASTPTAKTCAASTGRCWPAPAGPTPGSTRTRPT